MTLAVLIHEETGNIQEIEVDIDPRKQEIYRLLSGRATFVGQWPELDVVIMKAVSGERENTNVLPPPFHDETIMGKVLLIRMDEHSEPQDFTKDEFMAWVEQTPFP